MRTSKGFTIIELTLAMSFVSMLLIAVAMLSIQLSNQYSRGLTLKEIAQAGTEASNDMKRTLSQAQIGQAGMRTASIAGGGRVLCTGTYSYVANDPRNLDAANAGYDASKTIKIGVGNKVPVRLAKVLDPGGTYCAAGSVLNNDSGKNIETDDATELLSGGSRLLAVRQLTITPEGKPTTGPFAEEFNLGRGIYEVTLMIGTGIESEIDATSPLLEETKCKAPTDTTSNIDFCAIDTFKFTARVGSSNR